MERLTMRNSDGTVSQPTNTTVEDVFYRLAYYEDMEVQGRLVVPPCKVGDVIYRHGAKTLVIPCIVTGICVGMTNECEIIKEVLYTFCNGLKAGAYFDDFGKTVFLTREEAEQALKGLTKD